MVHGAFGAMGGMRPARATTRSGWHSCSCVAAARRRRKGRYGAPRPLRGLRVHVVRYGAARAPAALTRARSPPTYGMGHVSVDASSASL